MASKFVLTAQLRLQAPSQQQLATVRAAIQKSVGNFNIPLKLNLGRNTVNNAITSLTKLDKKLDVTTNKFLLFIQMVKNAFQQLANTSFIVNTFGRVIAQINKVNRAINTMINSANNLTSKTTQTQLQLAGLNVAMKNIASNGVKSNNVVNGLGESIRDMGFSAAQAIKRFGTFSLIHSTFLSLFHAIRSSVSEAITFQAEVIKLRQVTGQSATGIKELTNEIDFLSVSLGVSSKELLDVTVTLAQAGQSAKNTKIALEAIAKASLSPSFDDMNSIVEGSIAIFQQFGKEAKDLEGILGSMNAVAAAFAVESDDLNTAIRRTGGAFQAAGGDINELFALFTSVRQTTRESAESIATGFRTIFARLQRNRTQDFLKQFGVDLRFTAAEAEKFGKSANTFVGPFEAIKRLSLALNQLDSADPRFAQIVEELGGFRQISKVIPLIKQFSVAEQALQVAKEGTTSIDENAILAQESLFNQLVKVREEFQLLIRTVADDDGFKTLITNVLNLAKSFIRLADSFKPILPALLALGVGQLGRNTSEYLAGMTSGFGFPGGGGGDKNIRTSNRFKPRMNRFTSFAQTSSPNMLALSVAANSVANSFGQLDSVTSQVVGGFSNVVSQFAILKQLIQSIGPFNKGRTDLNKTLNRIETDRDKSRELQAVGRYLAPGPLLDANRAQRRNLATGIRKDQSKLPGMYAAVYTLDAIAASIAGVVAISSVLADTFNQVAEAELRLLRQNGGVGGSPGKFLTSSTLGGIAGGAGQGAGIGAGIGFGIGTAIPGVGNVVGTAIGGAVGGVVGGGIGGFSANKRAKNILAQLQFNDRFASVGRSLSDVTAGNQTPDIALSSIRSGLLDLQNELRSVSDPDRRTDLIAQGQSVTTGLQEFFFKLSQSTNTLDEFKNTVGTDVLDMFAYLTKKSLPDFLTDIDKSIQQNKTKNAVDAEAVRLQIEFNENIKTQLLFTSAIEEATTALMDFEASIKSTLGFASGGAGGAANFNFGAVNTIKSGKPITNIKQFQRDIGILGSSFGSFGQEQAGRAVTAAKISKELPSILLDLVKSSALDDSGNISDRLTKRLEDKFGSDIPKEFIDAIVNKSEELRGADKKDTKLLEVFANDPKGAIGQFTKILEGQADGLAESGAALSQKFNEYGESLFEIIRLNQNYVSELNGVINLIDQRERFRAEAFGVRQDFGGARARDLQRQFNITGNAGFVNNPAAIGAALSRGQAEIRSREFKLQSSELTLDDRQREVELLTDAKLRVAELNDALKFLADGAGRAATNVEELNDVRSRREARLGVFTQFLGSDNAGRRDINRNLNALGLVQQNGNLNGVRQDQRGEVLRLLEAFDPEKFKEVLITEAKARGINPNGLVLPGDKENELIKQVTESYNRAIEAQSIYTKALGDNTTRYVEEQRKLFTDFLTEFKKIFVEGRQEQLTSDITSKQIQFNLADENQAKFNSIKNLSGGVNNIGAIQRLLDIEKKINQEDSGKGLAFNRKGFESDSRLSVLSRGLVGSPFGVAGLVNNFTDTVGERVGKKRVDESIASLTSKNLGISEEKANKLRLNVNNRIGEASVGNDMFKRSSIGSIIAEEIKKVETELAKEKESNIAERKRAINDVGGNDFAESIIKQKDIIGSLISQLPKDFNVDANTKQLELLNTQLQELNRKLGNPPGFASGGFIPGAGSRDNTLIKTTPGEFVVRKPVAQRYGNMLAMMNKTGRLPAFANGGFVGGESLSGGVASLNGAIANFGTHINKMIDAISSFPREISMQATHTVHVVHNGAQVFANLEPGLIRLIEGKVSQAINNLASKNLDIGHIADADLFSGSNSSIGGVNFNG